MAGLGRHGGPRPGNSHSNTSAGVQTIRTPSHSRRRITIGSWPATTSARQAPCCRLNRLRARWWTMSAATGDVYADVVCGLQTGISRRSPRLRKTAASVGRSTDPQQKFLGACTREDVGDQIASRSEERLSRTGEPTTFSKSQGWTCRWAQLTK